MTAKVLSEKSFVEIVDYPDQSRVVLVTEREVKKPRARVADIERETWTLKSGNRAYCKAFVALLDENFVIQQGRVNEEALMRILWA